MDIRKFSELIKELNKIKQEVMQDDVAVKAVELGQTNVVSEIYSVYTPVMYERQYEMMTSFEINPVTDGIEFSHNRMDGDRNVSEIVEYGHEASEGYQYIIEGESYLEPRPFFATTVEDLREGEFKKALAQGLRARGLKVE